MSSIKKIHTATYAPIADLITYSPLPSAELQQIDPFLFLNHHGPQVYKPMNNGLPFGPHPHRGMETMTFILEGDILHKDSGGHESVIEAGGIQYMTAGKGLIHAEVSSQHFKQNGGPLEILQLWLNLPARLKMTEPRYTGLQKEELPVISEDEGKVTVNLVSGSWKTQKAALQTHTEVMLSWIVFKEGGELTLSVPADHNILFYVIGGSLSIGEEHVANARQLVEFLPGTETVSVKAGQEAVLLFGHGRPLNEPVVAYGPFVMNTEDEIRQAYEDYKQGRFGTWQF